MKRLIKISGMIIAGLIVVLFGALVIYSSTAYEAEDVMFDAIDNLNADDVTRTEDNDDISFTVDDPTAHILILPGGLVDSSSYEYMAMKLAMSGYDVTIFKAFFHLAILTPNYAERFVRDDMDNIIVGHSLGGTVASMIAADDERVSTVILLGSYPYRDITDKEVLIITAEHDLVLDQDAYEDALKLAPSDAKKYMIEGGNHAQFGWYGPQDGDGEATIGPLTQQNRVIVQILAFLP